MSDLQFIMNATLSCYTSTTPLNTFFGRSKLPTNPWKIISYSSENVRKSWLGASKKTSTKFVINQICFYYNPWPRTLYENFKFLKENVYTLNQTMWFQLGTTVHHADCIEEVLQNLPEWLKGFNLILLGNIFVTTF